MSLLFKRAERRSMDWWGHDAPGPGLPITEHRATHLAPVFAAWRHIIDFVCGLPICEYRQNDDGTRTKIPLSGPFRAEDMTGRAGLEVWIGQLVYGMLAHGNSVGWIVDTDGFGYPTVIRWLRRQEWSFDELSKQWTVAGAMVPSSQLVHVPWIVPSGCTLGLSPIEHFAQIVRAGLSAQEYADIKRGGGVPPSHLKNTAQKLQTTQSQEVQSRATASFASGKPFVTGSDWDLSIMSIPPNHAMFIETLKMSANEIASIYGLDPSEVGGSAAEPMTYKNEEFRDTRRATDVRPYLVRLEKAFARWLPNRQFVTFDVDSTIRTDIKTRTDVVGAQLADGRLSLNEARAIEERPPVAGGDYHNTPRPPAADPATREEAQ